MKKMTYEDAYFVRMKCEKSIKLPKSPLKTPKSPVSSFVAILDPSHPFSPLKHFKQQQKKPSQQQLNSWIQKKQVQVKRILTKQQTLNRQLSNQNNTSNSIKLRKKQDWKRSQQLKSNKKIELSTDTMSSQNSHVQKNYQNLRNGIDSLNESRILNEFLDSSSESIYFENIPNKNKIIQQPQLLKYKQTPKLIKCHSGLKYSQTKKDLLSNKSQKGNSMNHSFSDLKLFEKSRLSVQRTNNSTFIFDKENSKENSIKKSISRTKKEKQIVVQTDSSSKNSRMNSIYEDSLKGNRLIKKYVHRQISPIERKDLKNKYSHLQKRLDSILRSVRTDKSN